MHACRPLPPTAAVELSGSQRLPSGTQLHVALVLWRLAAQSTDVLLSVSRPQSPEATAADPPLVRALHASLRIHDWSLFNG